METYNWCAIWLFFSTAFIDSLISEVVLQKSLQHDIKVANNSADYLHRQNDRFYTPRWSFDGIFGINSQGELYEFRYTDNLNLPHRNNRFLHNQLMLMKHPNRSAEPEKGAAARHPDETKRFPKRSLRERLVSYDRPAGTKDEEKEGAAGEVFEEQTTPVARIDLRQQQNRFNTTKVDAAYYLQQMSMFNAIALLVNIVAQVCLNEFKVPPIEMCLINVCAQLCSVFALVMRVHNIQALNFYMLAFTYGLNFFNFSHGKCPGKNLSKTNFICLEICQSFMALLSMTAVYLCQITVVSAIHLLILVSLICWFVYKYFAASCPSYVAEGNYDDDYEEELDTSEPRVYYTRSSEMVDNVVISREPMKRTTNSETTGVDLLAAGRRPETVVCASGDVGSAPSAGAATESSTSIAGAEAMHPIEQKARSLFKYYIYILVATHVSVRVVAEIVPLLVYAGIGSMFYATTRNYLLFANMIYLWMFLEWVVKLMSGRSSSFLSTSLSTANLLKLMVRTICGLGGAVMFFRATLDKWAVGVHIAIMLLALVRPTIPLLRHFIDTELLQYRTIQMGQNCAFLLDYGHYLPVLFNFIITSVINFATDSSFFIVAQSIVFATPVILFSFLFLYRQFIL